MSEVLGHEKKYEVGNIFGSLKLISKDTDQGTGKVTFNFKCTVCGKEKNISGNNVLRFIKRIEDGQCHCNSFRHTADKIVKLVEEIKSDKRTKYASGKQIGVYKIISRDKNLLKVECTVCNRIRDNIKVNIFAAWDHERCICDKSIAIAKALSFKNMIRNSLTKSNSIVRTNESLLNGNFDNSTTVKVTLQDDMYNSIYRHGVSGECLVLAGPNIKRHLSDIRSTFSRDGKLIHIVENNLDVFNRQIMEYISINETWKDTSGEVHSLKDNVVFTYGNISGLPPYAIVDADLMGSFKTEGDVITSLLSKQAYVKNSPKAFIFTLSERAQANEGGYDATIKWIENNVFPLIGAKAICRGKVSVMQPKQLLYKYKLLISIEEFGKAIDIMMFHYNDQKGPMITCCLIYK